MNGFMGGMYRIAEWIMRLAYVNILWIGFTLIGLIIFGFMPATAAVFAVTRKWFMGDTEVPVFKTFMGTFKKEFIKVNILGVILSTAAFILYVDYLFVNSIDGVFQILMSTALILIGLLFIITACYLLPVYVHYELKLLSYFKHSLIIGLLNPLYTIIMVIGLLVVYQVFMYIPGLIPFFIMSSIGSIMMGAAYSSFKKLEGRTMLIEVASNK